MAGSSKSAAAAPRGSDVRGQILAAATRLFAAHGFEGTSLQDVAEDVGIRKPSLLYHFASKDELRHAVLRELLAHWKETLPRVLLAATAGDAQFDGVMRELVAFFAADADRARLIIREALDRPAELRAELAEHVQPVAANMAEYVRKGQKRGELHAEVDAAAYLFHVIVLLLCGIAFGDSLGALVPEHLRLGSRDERLLRELLRIARSSLFTEGALSSSRLRVPSGAPASSKTPRASSATRAGARGRAERKPRTAG